jgi:branched-subunit amino acid transport protein AzlD
MKSLNLLSTSALLLMFSFDRAREFRNLSCKPSLLNYHQLSCNSCSRLTGAWELRKLSCKLSLLNYHQLSCTSCSPLALFLTRARENSHANSRFSTIINSHATLVLVWPGHESWENSHTNSHFSTIINYHATLVLLCLWPGQEKTLMQTLASQLSSTLMQLLFSFVFDQGKRKLSCKLSLLNYHQLSCNSCSRLTGAWELRKLSCKLSLLNYQLSCNSCSPLALSLTRARENSRGNSRFSTIINSHATLVLVWPGHENWENSHANSRFSTLINSHATLVLLWHCLWPGQEKTLMQTLASQLSSTLMQLLFFFVFDQGKRKLSCKLSLLNSRPLCRGFNGSRSSVLLFSGQCF